VCDKENKTVSRHKMEQKQQPSVPYALAGGIVGAGLGLLASPENGKRIVNRIGQSSVLKIAGREVLRTTQDMLTEQAMLALRQNATGYIQRYTEKLHEPRQETHPDALENNQDPYQEKYEELKEENKNLHNNLQRIEDKLNTLLEVVGKDDPPP
jgi:gas vesicle protein